MGLKTKRLKLMTDKNCGAAGRAKAAGATAPHCARRRSASRSSMIRHLLYRIEDDTASGADHGRNLAEALVMDPGLATLKPLERDGLLVVAIDPADR